MAVSAVLRLVYFLAPCPSESKEQTAAHRRDALCPSTTIQKQETDRYPLASVSVPFFPPW
jgi:hypothetical protein